MSIGRTTATAPRRGGNGDEVRTTVRLAHSRPTRAVSRNGNRGTPGVLGVRPDRDDHEVEFVGAVDLARYTIGHIGPDELGFGEVIEPVNTLRVVILQQEHGAGRVFRPREQEEMIGAEVEHRKRKGRRWQDPRPIGSAVEGLAGGLLRRVIAQRGA